MSRVSVAVVWINENPNLKSQISNLFVAVLVAAAAAATRAADAPPPVALPVADVKRDVPVSFEKEVLPVLSANCLACHNRTKAKADLVLETPTDMLKGGESGPAVVPKNADASLLLKVSAHRQDPVMPPKGNKVAAANLTPDQLGLLKLWIEQGATGSVGGGSVPTVQLQPLPAGLSQIFAAAVSPDGQYAACARGSEVHVYHLPTARLVCRLAGHRDLVQSLAFSPDGNLLASGAFREVALWRRPRDAKAFSVTSAARGAVNAVDASPDGSTVATGGADGVVRLWGAKDGRPVKELTGHTAAVISVRFSPDGSRILSTSADRTVRVWIVADATVLAQTTISSDATSVAWLGAKQVIAACGDAIVRIWDLPDAPGAPLASPKELKGHDGAVTCVCPIPGAPTHLLTGGADGTVRRWDVQTGTVVKQWSHGAPVTSVAARPDGKRFASAGGNVAKLWDAEGKPLAELKGDRYATEAAANRERDLAFAASEVTYHKGNSEALAKRQADQVERVKKAALADVEADKAVAEKQKALAEKKKLLDDMQKALEEKKKAKAPEAELKALEAEAKAAEGETKKLEPEVARAQGARTAAGDELRLAIKSAQAASDAAADADEAFHAAEREHKQVEAELAALKAAAAAAEGPVRAVAFSPDGALLCTGGDDAVAHLYGAETGAAYESFRGHQGAVTAVAFAGSTPVTGGADGAAVGWDTAALWTKLAQLGTGDASSPFADRVTALDFSPDGKLLATGGGVPSREGEAMLWEVDTGALLKKFDRLHSDAVLALDVSADGKLLATAAADRFMKVTEISSGRLVKSFEGHSGHVLGVSFQRTGRTLVTGAADNTVKVWDLVAGEQRKTVSGFDKEVTSVRFAGSTDQFVATAGDGKVRLLRPDGGEVRSFPGASGFLYAASTTRDGATLIAGGEDGTLRAWNVADGKPLATLPPPPAAAK